MEHSTVAYAERLGFSRHANTDNASVHNYTALQFTTAFMPIKIYFIVCIHKVITGIKKEGSVTTPS
jgi:hypothetical protein